MTEPRRLLDSESFINRVEKLEENSALVAKTLVKLEVLMESALKNDAKLDELAKKVQDIIIEQSEERAAAKATALISRIVWGGIVVLVPTLWWVFNHIK